MTMTDPHILILALAGILIVAAAGRFYRHQCLLRDRAYLMREAVRNRDFSFRLPVKGLFFGERAMQQALNDMSLDIKALEARKEVESWQRLTRVLTHEIMNTITPIASLSETLLNFEGVNTDVKNGLSTISQSSKSLIKFVESYRNLTRVAPPVKRAFYLRELAERVIGLTREQTVMSGATCTYEEKSEDIILYADEGQIFTNLIEQFFHIATSQKMPRV